MSDQLEDDEVRNCIRETFVKSVAPDNIIWLFHKYDIGVLTENDIQRVKGKTSVEGPMEGAQLLLNRLPLYQNWFPCLMKVLQDEHAKLGHVAKTMQDKVNDLKTSKLKTCKNSTDEKVCPSLKNVMHNPTEVDLLLIGKTGSGKSATGNAILRRKAFKSKSSVSSVTKNVRSEVSDFNNRVIKVVDGTGVGDTRLGNQESMDLVINNICCAIALNPRGYHAFLLVVRFGCRFTKEDNDTIVFLKKIFRDDFVRNFCILVISCGDNFESESEETGQTFKEWCDEQEGVFQELLRECNNRAVLFDNRTKDEDKRNRQVAELIQMVDNLRFPGHRYSDAHFEIAKDDRQRMMIEAKVPIIREEIMTETSLILQKLEIIENNEVCKDKIEQLEILHKRTQNLLDVLQDKDKETGILHKLANIIKSMRRTIDEEIKSCRRVMDERERIRKQEEENIRPILRK